MTFSYYCNAFVWDLQLLDRHASSLPSSSFRYLFWTKCAASSAEAVVESLSQFLLTLGPAGLVRRCRIHHFPGFFYFLGSSRIEASCTQCLCNPWAVQKVLSGTVLGLVSILSMMLGSVSVLQRFLSFIFSRFHKTFSVNAVFFTFTIWTLWLLTKICVIQAHFLRWQNDRILGVERDP